MIKKELFSKAINLIKKCDDGMVKRIRKISLAEFENSPLHTCFKYEDMLVEVLSESFDYDSDLIKEWIEYFCYDLRFGQRNASSIVGRSFNDAEELYDFLLEMACDTTGLVKMEVTPHP